MPTNKKTTWPNVSFAMATYNSARTLEEALSSIRNQEYEGDVEIVIADGGSTDNTLEIAEKYKAKINRVPKDKQNAEYNKGVAVKNTSNEIIAFTDHDNILPHTKWLEEMIRPLVEHEDIFGSAVLHFYHDMTMTPLDRYFALFGVNDPVPFFFNKSAHQSWMYNGFHLRGKVVEETEGYYIVDLDPERIPALGGNGAILRRTILEDANYDPAHFFHIDIHADIARAGSTRYAFAKQSVKHLTNNSLFKFLSRRKYFMQKYALQDQSLRRWTVYEPGKDKWLLLGYALYSVTFIGPLYHSFRGFLKIRDGAWFIHPLMCFSILAIYGYATIEEKFRNVFLAK